MSKLRTHGAEGSDATGTEFLDRFGCVQAPDRKRAEEGPTQIGRHFAPF